MNSYTVLIPFLILSLVLPCVCKPRKRGPIRKWLKRLDGDVKDISMKLPEIEDTLENKVNITREYLKEELIESIVPGYIEKKVDKYLADVLSGRGIVDLISRYIVKHMNNLNQLREKNTFLSNRLAILEEDMSQMKKSVVTNVTETFRNVTQNVSELASDFNTTRVTMKLEIDIEENLQEVNNLTSLNSLITTKKTLRSSIEGMEHNLTTSPPLRTFSSPLSGSLSAKTGMDLLVGQYGKEDYFKRLELNSFAVSNFPPRLIDVSYVIYIPSLRSLLISGWYKGNKLATINIDTHSLTPVKEGIYSKGMALDEERQLVFLTTITPTRILSRLEINGWKYKEVINIKPYGRYPLSLAVDSEQQKIYACFWDKLVSLDYNGHNVQTLYTGKHIKGVTLVGDALYFTGDTSLMKRSLSNNINKKLLTISSNPSTIVYYNNTLYALDGSVFIVIYVGDENNVTAQYGLVQLLSGKYSMCLIPAETND